MSAARCTRLRASLGPGADALDAGLTLDVARSFYTPSQIENLIELVHRAGGDFLHLHASDDQNYALPSALLGQTQAHARLVHGIWVDTATRKPFLSWGQLNSIERFAHAHGVELIVEIDTPGHVGAIQRLVRLNHPRGYSDRALFNAAGELRVGSPLVLRFVESLDGEVLSHLRYGRHFSTGGDEFANAGSEDMAYVHYVRALNRVVQAHHMTLQLWNDGFTTSNYKAMPRSVQVMYWDYSDFAKPQGRATMPQLLRAGFPVLNYSGYYLYYLPSRHGDTRADRTYAVTDLLSNWQLGTWAQRRSTSNIKNVIGASISIWSDERGTLPASDIARRVTPLLRAMVTVMRQERCATMF